MSNRGSLSEEALARMVCEGLGRRSARILIGGLGMGYTLRAALDAASLDSRVIVSELVPAVIDWNRGPLASLARRPLEVRRLEVRSGSIIDILSVSQHCFDGIILDADNGPEAVLYQPNHFLYSAGGLELVKGALAADGTLGVWSADRSTCLREYPQRRWLQPAAMTVAPSTRSTWRALGSKLDVSLRTAMRQWHSVP
jgi:spermidine synthase